MANAQNTVRQKIAISRALSEKMASSGSRVVKGLRRAANGSHAASDGRPDGFSAARSRG
jgi:hypothetical protein